MKVICKKKYIENVLKGKPSNTYTYTFMAHTSNTCNFLADDNDKKKIFLTNYSFFRWMCYKYYTTFSFWSLKKSNKIDLYFSLTIVQILRTIIICCKGTYSFLFLFVFFSGYKSRFVQGMTKFMTVSLKTTSGP